MTLYRLIISAAIAILACSPTFSAHAETTLFPNASFGVAGPIPSPGNLSDLVGPSTPGTAVTFDPGDLGFLRFDSDITAPGPAMPNLGILFNIVSAVPSNSGQLYVSVLLGNIAAGAGGGLTFTRAVTAGFSTPDGDSSIFQFTEVPGTGTFAVSTDAFVSACADIGGCNTIVIGTSGLGAAGGGSFLDGGTLTFASVVAASPEPGTWFLMILGFLGIAWRAKHEKYGNGSWGGLSVARSEQGVSSDYHGMVPTA